MAAALGSGFGGWSPPAKAVIPDAPAAGFPVASGTIPTGYTVVSSGPVDNPSGAQTQGTVFCPAGTVVWSGGALGQWGNLGQNINGSVPVQGGGSFGWVVWMNNATASDLSFTVYAVCANKPRHYSMQFAEVPNPNGTQSTVTVQCPLINLSGTRSKVLGGGGVGVSTSVDQNLNSSFPLDRNTWQANENNNSGADSDLQIYVLCGTPSGYSMRHVGTPTRAHSTSDWSVDCLSGEEIGGGVNANSSSLSANLAINTPFSNLGWEMGINNATPGRLRSVTYVICVS